MRNKEREISIRREVAFWQRGAVMLAALLVIFALVASWVIGQREDREAALEAEIGTLREIQRDAVARLGEQAQAFEDYRSQVELDRRMEEAAYAQAMAAYEAAGIYRYIGVCTLTAYCCESRDNPHICGTGTGLTATGLPVAPGMVAVDPDIIPLGSTVVIGGVSYLAADTGVSGYHIDIAVQTHEEAAAFGVSSAEVWIIPPGGNENGG